MGIRPRIDQGFKQDDEKLTSYYVGLFGTTWALMQFMCAPLLGAISDVNGRRRVLLIPCFGLGLNNLLIGFSYNVTWLSVGRIISGITASSFATAGAYVANVTSAEERSAAFGILKVAF